MLLLQNDTSCADFALVVSVIVYTLFVKCTLQEHRNSFFFHARGIKTGDFNQFSLRIRFRTIKSYFVFILYIK